MKYILVYFSLISLLSVIVTVRGKKAAQRFAMGVPEIVFAFACRTWRRFEHVCDHVHHSPQNIQTQIHDRHPIDLRPANLPAAVRRLALDRGTDLKK